MTGKSDPYVKVKIGKNSYRTPTVKKQLNPIWNSIITEERKGLIKDLKKLDFEVYDWDKVSDDDLIGTFSIPLNNIQKDLESPVQWCKLKLADAKHKKLNAQIQIRMKITFDKNKSEIRNWTHVMELTVKTGKGFKNMDFLSRSDPYIRIGWGSLTYKTQISSTSGENPTWNETQFVFVDENKHKDYSMRFTAMDSDYNQDDKIGTGLLHAKDIFGDEKSNVYTEPGKNFAVKLHEAKYALDKNLKMHHNEKMSCGEVLVNVRLLTRKNIEQTFYDDIIKTFDTNGNGVLEKDEVAHMFATIGYNSGDIAKFIDKFDTDYNKALDKKEILSILSDADVQDSALAPKLIFHHLSNRDSYNTYSRHLMYGVVEETGDDDDHITIKIKDRKTGLLVQEHIPGYVKLSLRMMYDLKLSRALAGSKAVQKILKGMSKKEGKKFDNPASVKDIPKFINQHALDTSILRNEIKEFKTFNDFFARGLKLDARPIGNADVVSPADSRFHAFNSVLDAKVWVKGKKFTIQNLLGPRAKIAEEFEGGSFMINRLAPQDYHRWHYPCNGNVLKITPIDGALYTVNPVAINKNVDVYTENKRCVIELDCGKLGKVIMFAIGATMVGSYRLFDGNKENDLFKAQLPVQIKKGEVAGEFRFGGSTVLTLFQPKKIKFEDDLLENTHNYFETLVEANVNIGHALK